ncbi:hypothetical protein SOVF_106770 [Spinacia oleracea]|nr:hypothetical protein SOVF_106770 [Spinacia oleracea]
MQSFYMKYVKLAVLQHLFHGIFRAGPHCTILSCPRWNSYQHQSPETLKERNHSKEGTKGALLSNVNEM